MRLSRVVLAKRPSTATGRASQWIALQQLHGVAVEGAVMGQADPHTTAHLFSLASEKLRNVNEESLTLPQMSLPNVF